MRTARSLNARFRFSLVLVAGLCFSCYAKQVLAQSGTSFYYYNSRTGRTYSQQVYVGPGSAYAGFSYGRPGRYYSAGSGYNRRGYYGGNTTYNGYRGYRYRYFIGR